MALWILHIIRKERPRGGLKNLIISTEVSCKAYARPRAGADNIGSNAEAGNHKLNARNTNIA